jgi:potassium-dependent mechanosensitive channel
MKIHRAAVFGMLLLAALLTPSNGRAAEADTAKDSPQETTPAASTDQAALAELRTKREKAQAELDAVAQPKTMTSGAPPGTPQEELLERRTLLHHIVRRLDEQIDESLRLEQARRTRADAASAASTETNGRGESPPYSVFFADRLWDSVFSLRLAVEGLQSQLSLIDLRSGRARESLQTAEERLRQLSERLESTHGGPADDRQRWLRDLEMLRRRAAAALLQATDLSKTRIGEELSDAKARLESAEHRLTAVESQVEFAEADLGKIRTRLSDERRHLAEALDQTTADRHRQFDQLGAMETQATRQSKGGRQPSKSIRRLQESIEVGHVRMDNLSLKSDLLQLLVDVVEGERQLWESRFAILQGRDAGKIREAYERFTPLFTNFQASRDYVRQQVSIVAGQIAELETRLKNSRTPDDRTQARALLDAHREREAIYNSTLQRLDQAARFLERWKSMFKEQQHELPLSARLKGWSQHAWDRMKDVWNWEVFSAEDTIEVEGKKITGHRSVTVGKILTALLILAVGYWLCLYLAALIGRLAVMRFGIDAELANLLRQWSQALLLTVLIVTSLLWVKIPLTIFAFLGGAFAIGIGFGAQNLLKNVISGILLLIERPLRVGDLIEVENVHGRVTTIGLRSSTVRDSKGVVTLIPNSSFLERTLTNWTYSSRIGRFSLRVGAPYGSPTQVVMGLLSGLAAGHPQVLKTPQPQVLLDEFRAEGRIFTLNYWLEIRPDVDPYEVASDLRFAIEQKFAEAGVKILPAA